MFDGLGDMDKAQALYLAIILVVVLFGSLSLRRIGWRRGFGMAAAWIAIFAVIITLASYRDDLGGIFSRMVGNVDPASGYSEGNEFHVRARNDGHFWVRARIDDQSVLFLVDTGASGIVLTEEDARRVGIDPAALTFTGLASTANGQVRVASTRVAKLEVGDIVRTNVVVNVTEGELDANLLGMAFLRTLRSWRVEGDTLVMRP